ncbi:MAG TPA: hypothetical protein VMT47_11775 [Polyangia bacterium]|nr:hypothetical protein [Polyangia bacterium]
MKTMLLALLASLSFAVIPVAGARSVANETAPAPAVEASVSVSDRDIVSLDVVRPGVLDVGTIVVVGSVPKAPARHVETDQEHIARLMSSHVDCSSVVPTNSDMWIGVRYCH